MNDTTPQARRVMENGGEWGLNMGITHPRYGAGTIVGTSPLMVSFANAGQYRHTNKESEDCVALMIPDLTDPATCAVLWGQIEARAEALGLTVHRSHRTGMGVWVSAESRDVMARAWEWQPEKEALARFFEWVAALEVK